MRAIVLILCSAQLTLHARPDLGADADAIALLDVLDGLSDLDGLANHFVADAERALEFTPAAGDGVDVGAANAAALDLDIDVVVLERLGLELGLVVLGPSLGRVYDEALKSVWVAHFVCLCLCLCVYVQMYK